MRALLFTLACILCTSCSALLPLAERGIEAVSKTAVEEVIEEVGEESVEYLVRVELLKLLFVIASIVVLAAVIYKNTSKLIRLDTEPKPPQEPLPPTS